MTAKRERVLLVKSSGRVGRLRPGGKLQIGRHASNDIVIAEGRVSRYHATIEWGEGEEYPHVEDKSANGTMVNGERIEEIRTLKGGETVEVGSVVVELELVGAEVATKRAAPRGRSVSFGKLLTSKEQIQRVLVGYEDDRATGTLQLQLGDQVYSITYQLGRVQSARGGDGLTGGLALGRVCTASSGRYSFEPGQSAKSSRKPLDLSMKTFLIQARTTSLNETQLD